MSKEEEIVLICYSTMCIVIFYNLPPHNCILCTCLTTGTPSEYYSESNDHLMHFPVFVRLLIM
jgi:hypothetical protein